MGMDKLSQPSEQEKKIIRGGKKQRIVAEVDDKTKKEFQRKCLEAGYKESPLALLLIKMFMDGKIKI